MSRGKSGSMSTRLSSKILLAMGSVLFLFALVLCLYYYIVSMPQRPGIKQSTPHASLLAEQMKASLQEVQKNESQFLLNPSPDKVSKHKESITQFISFSNQFAKNTKQSTNINKLVQQLDSAFLDLVQTSKTKGFVGTPGLLEKLNRTGQQLKEIVSGTEAGSLALAFLRIQRHEQEYVKTSSSIELRNLQSAIKSFSQLLRDTSIEEVDAQIIRKGVIEYNIALDRYQAVSLATYDRSLSATMGMEQRRQLVDMQRAADNIESVINRVSIPDALLMVLDILKNEASYLLSGDDKYASQVNNGLDALTKTFNSSSILQENKNLLLNTLLNYRDTFTALVEQNAIFNNQLTKLIETSASLEALVNKVVKTNVLTASETTPAVAENGNNLGMIAAVAGLAVILIGLLVAVILGKSVSAPIINMANIIRRINTDKDFNVQLPVNSKNEIGILAQELNTLLQLKATSPDQPSETSELEDSQSKLADNQSILTDIAQDLRRQINEISEASIHMNSSAASQNELIDKVNSSITQLTASADDMSQFLSQSNEQSQLIANAVEQISTSVESIPEGAKAVTHSSSQISDIITLSTEIAEQASLLALNASVKAARAGSHGKEFTVIADEIAKLAQRSEEIAKEASQLTVNASSEVDEPLKVIDDSNKLMDQVHEAKRLNLAAAEESAKQAAMINTSIDELGKLAKSFASTFSEIDTTSGEQGLKCTAALEKVENLLEKVSGQSDETESDGDTESAIDEADRTNIPLTN